MGVHLWGGNKYSRAHLYACRGVAILFVFIVYTAERKIGGNSIFDYLLPFITSSFAISFHRSIFFFLCEEKVIKRIGILSTFSTFGLKIPQNGHSFAFHPSLLKVLKNGRNFHSVYASILGLKAVKMVAFLHFIHHCFGLNVLNMVRFFILSTPTLK